MRSDPDGLRCDKRFAVYFCKCFIEQNAFSVFRLDCNDNNAKTCTLQIKICCYYNLPSQRVVYM